MAHLQNSGEVYSALYVDFDSIYTRLFAQAPSLARTFATSSQRWMRWLEGHALRMMYGEGVRRRILKRCCYMNSLRYHKFRPFFLRTAFHVMDCQPLNKGGKSNADIHLVMDCMSALGHATYFDEFIILSGETDYTPLLLKLQEHARRTLVLSVGNASPTCAAASWRIREDWFLAQALEEQREEGEGHDENDILDDERYNAHEAVPPRHSGASRSFAMEGGSEERRAAATLPAYKRILLVESIKQLVAESSVPVPLPSVSQALQHDQEAPSDWYGAGTLRELLEILDLEPVVFCPAGKGHVYDPQRHKRPDGDDGQDNFRTRNPELYEFALKTHKVTKAPLLSPEQYATLLTMLVDEVNAHGFSRDSTIRQIEALCEDEETAIDRAQIGFVVDAVAKNEVRLDSAGKADKALTLAEVRRAFSRRVAELCRQHQLELDAGERALLTAWLQKAKAPAQVGR